MYTVKKNKKARCNIVTSSTCIICTTDYDITEEKRKNIERKNIEKKKKKEGKNEIVVSQFILHHTRRQTHSVCNTCVETYILLKLEENERKRNYTHKIFCPGNPHGIMRNMCKHEIDVTKMDLPSTMTKIHDRIARITILSNGDATICPNGECGNILITKGVVECTCNECNINWCNTCKSTPYHKGMTCGQHKLFQDKSVEGQKIKEMIEEGIIKQCPKCYHGTEKIDGCNKMTCSRCSVYWCWLCGSIIDGYGHFQEGGCNDRLFD